MQRNLIGCTRRCASGWISRREWKRFCRQLFTRQTFLPSPESDEVFIVVEFVDDFLVPNCVAKTIYTLNELPYLSAWLGPEEWVKSPKNDASGHILFDSPRVETGWIFQRLAI